MRNYNKYKKYKKKKRTVSHIGIVIILLCFMIALTIGYSTLRDTTTIIGSANIGSFTITYYLNGGTNVANPITTYYATSNAPLPIPTNSGYSFAGWHDNESLTGNPLATTPTRGKCKKFKFICKMGNSYNIIYSYI